MAQFDEMASMSRVLEELESDGYVSIKYVRVGDRFIVHTAGGWLDPNHSDMIDLEQEVPKSAAYADISRTSGVTVSEWSMTLKIGPAPDDEQLLAELFGVPHRRNYV